MVKYTCKMKNAILQQQQLGLSKPTIAVEVA